MLITLLLPVVFAAPPGFEATKSTERCQLYLGPALANGVVPMRAECHWLTVDLNKLTDAFSRWDDHDVPFDSVLSSDVVRAEGEVAWVHQVHAVKGVSDRECRLRMQRSPIAGGHRFEWTLDNGDLKPADGRVLVGYDDGFWEVTADPAGGVRAVHQLAYDPGGRVPGFLVRWFQTSGLVDIVTEMETWAAQL